MRFSLMFACLLACGALCACSTAPRGQQGLLGFVQDGSTRRDEVVTRLGAASASYESSRILAYRLAADAGGLYLVQVQDWSGICHSLILVFDDTGLLRRHALVRTRAQ